eukprot:CAMPEP_0194765492 /NCGR_PEP_ID=MMETSP0323_2-20130528/26814_1 /TAXON_ID=2866 ORGANISM="Crypthecodinium cohnii, Strain Seligo" /NCGR_SAMPLE_ID=MMETSP0323_2 /ASSEMBLY_ACC=CAM_ASM_000346 /LENGTH=48 /DNA_ID= /DNA_START= /DNA_END= /DNA_ORIENTATION=
MTSWPPGAGDERSAPVLVLVLLCDEVKLLRVGHSMGSGRYTPRDWAGS